MEKNRSSRSCRELLFNIFYIKKERKNKWLIM